VEGEERKTEKKERKKGSERGCRNQGGNFFSL
jgi:hypothetical protein